MVKGISLLLFFGYYFQTSCEFFNAFEKVLPFPIFLCVLLLDSSFLFLSRDSHSCSLCVSTILLLFTSRWGTVEKVIYLFSWGNNHGVKEIESYCPSHPFLLSYLDLNFRIPKKGRRVNSVIHVWRGKWASQVVLLVKKLLANKGDVRDTGLIPGSGRYPGRGHGNPLQYSFLENPGQRSLAGLQSIVSQRIGYNWSSLVLALAYGGI